MPERDALNFDAHNDLDKLQVRIRSARRNAGDLNELFQMIERRYIDYMNKGFETQGLSFGHRWKGLSQNYISWKRARGYPTVIGEKTGRMRSSLTGGAGYIRRIGKMKATFGQLHGYAPWTKAFTQGNKRQPARPITVSNREIKRWKELAAAYVRAQVSPIEHKTTHTERLGQGVSATYNKDGRAVAYRDPKTQAARRARMRSRTTGWGNRL